MLSLATPTFSGLPNSATKIVDAYDKVDTKLQNELASKISAFDSDIGNVISGATKMVKDIGEALKKSGMDLYTATQRVREALGGSKSAIMDIGEGLERQIFGDLTGVDEGTGFVRRANNMVDSVLYVKDGVQRIIQSGNFKNVSAVMSFVSDLTGTPLTKVFDLGAEAALIKGVITEVSNWGVPELVDEVFGAKWNEDKKSYDYEYDDMFRFSVTKRASESLSPTTSLAVIDQLMIHAGDAALVADNPAFPDQLLSGYRFPEGIKAGGPYPEEQTYTNYYDENIKLVSILDRLKPDWFYKTRQVYVGGKVPYRTDKVWNLEYISNLSEDAKTLLMTTDEHRAAALTAPFYRVESGITMIKNMYPYFVESTNA